MTKLNGASPLSRKAVLVAVNISQWTGRKLDKKVTEETNDRYNAAQDAGRFNKLLIAAEHLEAITKIVTKARDLHYSLTQPWTDKGPRILANVLYSKFADEFRPLKREFEVEADRFAAFFPSFIADRREALGKMFKESDYPSVETIRSKFHLDYQVLQFPDVADFRSDLDDDTVEEIRSQITTTTANVTDAVMHDTAERIVKYVGHMAKKLAEYKPSGGKDDPAEGTFRDSLVDNVRELADVLPAFNMTNDPRLSDIIERIKSDLCVEDADDLRKNDGARAHVQKSADEIVAAVNGLFG
jgi:hypothetical protein